MTFPADVEKLVALGSGEMAITNEIISKELENSFPVLHSLSLTLLPAPPPAPLLNLLSYLQDLFGGKGEWLWGVSCFNHL